MPCINSLPRPGHSKIRWPRWSAGRMPRKRNWPCNWMNAGSPACGNYGTVS
ncbi:methionine biosynthesis protein MetW [Paracoccus denitrificans]